MAAPCVRLQSEITREDVWKLVHWLQHREVRQFLSDTQDVSVSLMQILERVNLPVLTHLFNQNGRFFMIYNHQAKAVGFVRLVVDPSQTEIVIVIGDQKQWGHSLGSKALSEALKFAFYELRSPRVVARIKRSNIRSLRAFARAGFRPSFETAASFGLSLSLNDYLNQPFQKNLRNQTVVMTDIDRSRLKNWITKHFCDQVKLSWTAQGLNCELNKAQILDSTHLPDDVLSMRARALLKVNGRPMTVSLAYPHEANWAHRQLSVLSPVGTAVLGYREGDLIQWPVPTGFLEIEIKKLLYQPEAFGDYQL